LHQVWQDCKGLIKLSLKGQSWWYIPLTTDFSFRGSFMNCFESSTISDSAEKLLEILRSKHLLLATAESCTGGGIGAAITSIAGSSDVYLGGVVSYSNSVKNALLSVPDEVLSNVGAVSSECAESMAKGVLKLVGADVAVSVTGIAGPGGGTEEKPVGLVYFGLATSKGKCYTKRYTFGGDREAVRLSSVKKAIELLIEAVSETKE
jgi:PncC family amidohydrolase